MIIIIHLMLNESAMKKWLRFEMSKINSGIVLKKKTLADLVSEDLPKTQTKDQSVYYFNLAALTRLENELPSSLHSLLLPISFYVSLDISGNVYLADKPSLSTLKHLGEVPEKAELVDGKYWIGKSLVSDMIRRWPTVIQLVRY
jgi:uncharacterized protein (UPF0216 family)